MPLYCVNWPINGIKTGRVHTRPVCIDKDGPAALNGARHANQQNLRCERVIFR